VQSYKKREEKCRKHAINLLIGYCRATNWRLHYHMKSRKSVYSRFTSVCAISGVR